MDTNDKYFMYVLKQKIGKNTYQILLYSTVHKYMPIIR